MNLEAVSTLTELQKWMMLNRASNKAIYLIGGLMFLGLIMVLLTKRIRMPIIVGYVFLGIFLSVSLVERLPFLTEVQKEWYAYTISSFDYVGDLALSFIAFTIGTELSIKMFKNFGKTIFWIVIIQALAAFILVTSGILLLGQPIYVALIFGGLATASAPGSTVMVLQEYNAQGILTSMIMAVVGLGDAAALIIFSLVKPIALIKYSGVGEISFSNVILFPMVEIVGSAILGLLLGYISQRFMVSLHDKTKKVLTLVATIFGATASATLLHLSPLLTNMAVGFAYQNFARKNLEISAEQETLSIPLYAMFFILVGTKIKLSTLTSGVFLLVALVYTLSRVSGKIGGSYLGAWLGGAQEKIKKHIGMGLLSQSGLSLALAYRVQQDFADDPRVGLLIFNIILFASILSEVYGPLSTKHAITKVEEANVQ
ncbi:cation:proton antiporter [Natroniella sulfidigena]|uniref:cation:proton antiporter n=1 Tax=Natroniella sulfidigena TaxID=723921 RepID=UPI00200AA4E7|nr:cation:proton antiporter [Natroniella sulfidigena]MCK8817982.1 cation:proton antiporter [Natroniella sulfidigena]